MILSVVCTSSSFFYWRIVLFYRYIFLRIYILFFIIKSDIQSGGERERESGRSSIEWFNPQVSKTAGAVLIRIKHPGTSSRSPTRVQGHKALGHHWLLSQATNKELDGKSSCRDKIWCPYGIPAHSRRGLKLLDYGAGPIYIIIWQYIGTWNIFIFWLSWIF